MTIRQQERDSAYRRLQAELEEALRDSAKAVRIKRLHAQRVRDLKVRLGTAE